MQDSKHVKTTIRPSKQLMDSDDGNLSTSSYCEVEGMDAASATASEQEEIRTTAIEPAMNPMQSIGELADIQLMHETEDPAPLIPLTPAKSRASSVFSYGEMSDFMYSTDEGDSLLEELNGYRVKRAPKVQSESSNVGGKTVIVLGRCEAPLIKLRAQPPPKPPTNNNLEPQTASGFSSDSSTSSTVKEASPNWYSENSPNMVPSSSDRYDGGIMMISSAMIPNSHRPSLATRSEYHVSNTDQVEKDALPREEEGIFSILASALAPLAPFTRAFIGSVAVALLAGVFIDYYYAKPPMPSSPSAASRETFGSFRVRASA